MIVDPVDLGGLADALRERCATLRICAEGPWWHVAIAVPPVIGEIKVVNDNLVIAVRMALRLLDLRREARGNAAEFSS